MSKKALNWTGQNIRTILLVSLRNVEDRFALCKRPTGGFIMATAPTLYCKKRELSTRVI
jgi:hypothetical protein